MPSFCPRIVAVLRQKTKPPPGPGSPVLESARRAGGRSPDSAAPAKTAARAIACRLESLCIFVVMVVLGLFLFVLLRRVVRISRGFKSKLPLCHCSFRKVTL